MAPAQINYTCAILGWCMPLADGT